MVAGHRRDAAALSLLLAVSLAGCAGDDPERERCPSGGDHGSASQRPIHVDCGPRRTATSTPEVVAASPVPEAPGFASSVGLIGEETARRMSASWRPGCPVPLEDLRLLSVTHVGFDGRPRAGELVVHVPVADDIVGVFRALFDAGFPIEQVRLVDAFGADDDRSMAAHNTLAFNCPRPRVRAGGPSTPTGRP